MGRRPSDSESAWSRLSEDDPGDLLKLAADLLHQSLAGCAVRLAALMPLPQQRLYARGCAADQLRRAAVEPPLLRFAHLRPDSGDVVVEIAFRTRRKTAVDQPQRMAHARQARNRLGIGSLRLGLSDQVKHRPRRKPGRLTQV